MHEIYLHLSFLTHKYSTGKNLLKPDLDLGRLLDMQAKIIVKTAHGVFYKTIRDEC